MSKILQAMKKTGHSGADLVNRLESIGGPDLFPLPVKGQLNEFAKLANSLLVLSNQTNGLVVAFASTVKGEGASYVSYNVARHLSAMLDRKIAWVDANFKSPQKKLFGKEPGFCELLQDHSLFSQVADVENLMVLPNGNAKIKTNELLNRLHYRELLQQFRNEFFCTILDVPPILDSTEVVHLVEPTDGLLLVVEAGGLKYEVINHGTQVLSELGVNIIGSVLNKRSFDIPKAVYDKL